MVTRVLSVSGIEKAAPGKSFHGVDTNPAKGTMVAEFDVPADAWFFKGSSSPDLMPYSILMEIGLQTSGILTSWVKAPLTMGRDNILFRNLDATAKLLRRVDLRDKTIVNTSHATNFSMLGNMAVHKFRCELSVKGEEARGPFYTVDTSFGWFIPEVFEKQVGLDSGKKRNPWHEVEGASAAAASRAAGETLVLDVRPNGAGRAELAKRAGAGSRLLRCSDQTQFLDTMTCLPSAGRHCKGYVFGHKTVNKGDWFFSCHFWMDPVMPGSLGIESMMQCVEAFCVSQRVAERAGLAGLRPRFVHDDSDSAETKWKYRGQVRASVFIFIHPPIHPSINPSIHQSNITHPITHPSIHPSNLSLPYSPAHAQEQCDGDRGSHQARLHRARPARRRRGRG